MANGSKVRVAVRGFGAVVAAGILVAAGLSLVIVNQLRVGGPQFAEITRGQELIADVLPPPSNVLEGYLLASLAKEGVMSPGRASARLSQLHAAYVARLDYWSNQHLPDDLRTLLMKESDEPAQTFWRATERDLIRALMAGDDLAAQRAYDEATMAYVQHQAAVAKIVARARQLVSRVERDAVVAARSALLLGVGLVTILIAIVIAGVMVIELGVLRDQNQAEG